MLNGSRNNDMKGTECEEREEKDWRHREALKVDRRAIVHQTFHSQLLDLRLTMPHVSTVIFTFLFHVSASFAVPIPPTRLLFVVLPT
jgi:hypothetical protein